MNVQKKHYSVINSVLSVALGSFILVACSKAPTDTTSHSNEAQVNEESEQVAHKTTKNNDVSFDKYQPIGLEDGSDILKTIFFAKKPQQMSEDEVLRFYSAEYNAEPDAFKRKDMAEQLAPAIMKDLEKYKSINHYSILMADIERKHYEEMLGNDPRYKTDLFVPKDCTNDCDTKMVAGRIDDKQLRVKANISRGPYDMERKGYKIYRHAKAPYEQQAGIGYEYCLPKNMFVSDKQNIVINVVSPDYDIEDVCFLHVKDEAIARAVESNKQDSLVEGILYMEVSGGDQNLVGTIKGVEWQLRERPNKQRLNTFGKVLATDTHRID